MATLFHSLVSASEAVELAVTREPEPRTHALSADRHLENLLVVHADRCCPHGEEVLGYYTARQARKILANSDAQIVPCTCVLTTGRVALAA